MSVAYKVLAAQRNREVDCGCPIGGPFLFPLYVGQLSPSCRLTLFMDATDSGHSTQLVNKNNSEEDGMDECVYRTLFL